MCLNFKGFFVCCGASRNARDERLLYQAEALEWHDGEKCKKAHNKAKIGNKFYYVGILDGRDVLKMLHDECYFNLFYKCFE